MTDLLTAPAPAAQRAQNGRAHAEDATGNGAATFAQARPLQAIPLTPERVAAWDAFVLTSADGLPQHLSGWQSVLEETYGYSTHFVMAVEATAETDNGTNDSSLRVRGVLPLFEIKTPMRGRTLSTTPGGLCAADDAAVACLVGYAQDHARRLGAKSLVLQDSRHAHPGLAAVALHEAHLLDLAPGEEALWKALDRNIRRQVRMAQRNDVQIEIDRTGARLDDFYAVMSRFTHQAGTPIFPKRFLEAVVQAFPQGIHLVLAYHAGQPVGGYFQLALGKKLYGAWGATLPEALALRTVYLAYWEIMADAMAQGYTILDMGRSPADSNASKYKAQWGSTRVPIYQQAWQPTGAHAGQSDAATMATMTTQAQQDGRFQLVRRLWPKLPYGLATWLGPHVRRHVPFG